jgi:hypothetical protein
MRVTHDGWVRACDRRPLVHEVLAVEERGAAGGWKAAAAGRDLWSVTVRLEVRVHLGGGPVRRHLSVPPWEPFRLAEVD